LRSFTHSQAFIVFRLSSAGPTPRCGSNRMVDADERVTETTKKKRDAKKRWCIRASLVPRARRESHSLSPCARDLALVSGLAGAAHARRIDLAHATATGTGRPSGLSAGALWLRARALCRGLGRTACVAHGAASPPQPVAAPAFSSFGRRSAPFPCAAADLAADLAAGFAAVAAPARCCGLPAARSGLPPPARRLVVEYLFISYFLMNDKRMKSSRLNAGGRVPVCRRARRDAQQPAYDSQQWP